MFTPGDLRSFDPRLMFSVLASTNDERERHEELGCALQGPVSRPVRRALEPLKAEIAKRGRAATLRDAEALVQALDESAPWRSIAEKKKLSGRRPLRQDVLWPDPAKIAPRTLHVRLGLRAMEFDLSPAAFAQLGDLIAGVTAAEPRRLQSALRHPELAELAAALYEAELLSAAEPSPVPPPLPGVLFVGHNACIVASEKARVLIDPWLRPWHDEDPEDYRPLLPHQLGRIDAVLITHAHGDHLHLGSLLHLPRETPIVVPNVTTESIFSTDIGLRLSQLGFSRVKRAAWGTVLKFGDITVEVLPFHGEQPTTSELLHPGLRNEGNTYVTRQPGLSTAMLADTGRDAKGDMVHVCRRLRATTGPVDVAFAGTRAFRAAPILFLQSSVDSFLANVPLDLVGVSQKPMCDDDDALDCAEALGATFIVPYADGGAPWYWREGMGPTYRGYPAYTGFRAAGTEAYDQLGSDPFPERLVRAAARRYRGPGPVTPVLLRPGDHLTLGARGPRVRRFPGHGWPEARYASAD